MSKNKKGLLGVAKEERVAVLLLFLVFFLIKAGAAIFDNFVIALFLKRYGIKSLPVVYLINALVVFLFLSGLGRIVDRYNRRRFLMVLFLASGVLMAGMRLLVLSGFSFSYPLMFLLGEQINALFSLSFWLLAGEIFSARQVKRVTPLLAAGGILGTALGSFAITFFVTRLRVENIPFVSIVLFGVGFLLLFLGRKVLGVGRGVGFRRLASKEERKISRFFRGSLLFRLMFVMIFIPGLMVPLLDYQFNFLVDKAYATEAGLLSFYGVFKGFFSLVMFALHLFVTGRLFLRLGLPKLLRFLPFSYFFYFIGVSGFFKLGTAVTGKIVTKVVTNTIHNPAKKNLLTFFPSDVRGKVSFFMKGAASKLGKVTGSGLLVVLLPILNVRDLSFVGVSAALGGLIAARLFAKNYTRIVMRSVASRQIDLEELQEKDIIEIVTPSVREEMSGYLVSGNETLTLIAAKFFINSGEGSFFKRLAEQFHLLPLRTRRKVLEIMESSGTDEMIRQLGESLGSFSSSLYPYYVKLLAARGYPDSDQMIAQLMGCEAPDYLIVGLASALNYGGETLRGAACQRFSQLLKDEAGSASTKAAIIRQLRNPALAPELFAYLHDAKIEVRNSIIVALGNMRYKPALVGLLQFLSHPDRVVLRHAIVALGKMWDMKAISSIIPFLADSRLSIRRAAFEAVFDGGRPMGPLLEKRLIDEKNLSIVQAILGILRHYEHSNLDHKAFFRFYLEHAYERAYWYTLFEKGGGSPAFGLVRRVIRDNFEQLRMILVMLLSFFSRDFRYDTVKRGLQSSDPHERALGIEAVESFCPEALFKPFAFLFEADNLEAVAVRGKLFFEVKATDIKRLLVGMVRDGSFEERLAALFLVGSHGNKAFLPLLDKVMQLKDAEICAVAAESCAKIKEGRSYMRQELSLIDKLLFLERAAIFKALSTRELTAIARIADEEVVYSGSAIFEEGAVGDAMYLVASGKVAIVKKQDDKKVEVALLGPGDCFGEMALFENETRSAGAEAQEKTSLLKIHGYEFEQIMQEYPAISINICKVFSKRLRSTTKTLAGR